MPRNVPDGPLIADDPDEPTLFADGPDELTLDGRLEAASTSPVTWAFRSGFASGCSQT
jgi:hypothetical protein